MVRVLYINGNVMKRGGIEAFMMNYFRYMDPSKVHIDFLVHGYEKGVYDDEIIADGSQIYHVPTKSRHPLKYQKALQTLFETEHFDIVHSHLDAMSGWVLKIAKKCGVPVRIAHSHNTNHLTNNPIKRLVNEYYRKQIPRYATDLFACSQAAGEWLFGTNAKFKVINNAIDIDKYKFSEKKREAIRKQYGWNNKYVIGHVGRFDYQKNQEFLIPVLKQIRQECKNTVLVFVGEGKTMQFVKESVHKNELDQSVEFLGSRDNVNEIYNAFDVFVLPSRFEGLGIVAVEAETNGLPCLLSDQIPSDVKICDNVTMLSIQNSECWARMLEKKVYKRNPDNFREIEKAGYSLCDEAEKLQDLYIKMMVKERKYENCAYL